MLHCNKKNPGRLSFRGDLYAANSIISHFLDTFLADVLSTVSNQTAGRSAEETGRFKFLQNDSIVLHKNFQLIPLSNVERPPQFNRQYNSAQLVYLTNDTC